MAAAQVCPPGLGRDILSRDVRSRTPEDQLCDSPTTLGWVARWEHDKGPEQFVAVIEQLIERGLEFELILLGQQFDNAPDCLAKLLSVAADRIIHCGYAESREEYVKWLGRIDCVVSTAKHEFFGIAVVEAVASGAFPMLPNRLAYPEVFDVSSCPHRERYLYDGSTEHLILRLTELITSGHTAGYEDLQSIVGRFDWAVLAPGYDQLLETLAFE